MKTFKAPKYPLWIELLNRPLGKIPRKEDTLMEIGRRVAQKKGKVEIIEVK